jgi:hypothetical protein
MSNARKETECQGKQMRARQVRTGEEEQSAAQDAQNPEMKKWFDLHVTT